MGRQMSETEKRNLYSKLINAGHTKWNSKIKDEYQISKSVFYSIIKIGRAHV